MVLKKNEDDNGFMTVDKFRFIVNASQLHEAITRKKAFEVRQLDLDGYNPSNNINKFDASSGNKFVLDQSLIDAMEVDYSGPKPVVRLNLDLQILKKSISSAEAKSLNQSDQASMYTQKASTRPLSEAETSVTRSQEETIASILSSSNKGALQRLHAIKSSRYSYRMNFLQATKGIMKSFVRFFTILSVGSIFEFSNTALNLYCAVSVTMKILGQANNVMRRIDEAVKVVALESDNAGSYQSDEMVQPSAATKRAEWLQFVESIIIVAPKTELIQSMLGVFCVFMATYPFVLLNTPIMFCGSAAATLVSRIKPFLLSMIPENEVGWNGILLKKIANSSFFVTLGLFIFAIRVVVPIAKSIMLYRKERALDFLQQKS